MAKKEGLNGWLQRVRKTGEYSDMVVRVNGEEFRLHMLPLRNASGYFRNLPSSSNAGTQVNIHEPSGCKLVTIHDLPGGVEGFAIAVDMCYLVKPTLFSVHNVALVHAAAEFLAMDEITDKTTNFMHANIFSHWRYSMGFLQTFARVGAPVDEYVELRCQKVIVAACMRAFTEIKHVSAPSAYISGPLLTPKPLLSSACQSLTELLVAVGSLPDRYAAEIINTLVDSDVNLSLKCRQGRNVRSWLKSLMEDELCGHDRARCWVLLCLSRMLLKNAPAKRPWMELSSQYWCSLLEHADLLLPLLVDDLPLKTDCSSGDAKLEDQSQSYIKERLMGVKAILEEKIGESLDEMDEYLRDYKFSPETLMSLVDYYVSMGDDAHTEQSLEEIAGDVDRFLYVYAGEGSITPDMFLTLFKAFPASARASHDTVYNAIEKLLASNNVAVCSYSHEEQQQLWSVIDHCKLSPPVNEKALSNPMFLSQPEILESVLQHHSEELAKVDDADDDEGGGHLRHIMQKVINASLKLLEENSRRSREILELQKQYGELLGCRSQMLDGHEGLVDLLRKHSSVDVVPAHGNLHHASLLQLSEETEEYSEVSDSPSLATSSTGGTSHLALLPWRCSVREQL